MSSVDQQPQPLGGTKEEWLEKDRKYVWHHISPHNDHPMIAVSGEGEFGSPIRMVRVIWMRCRDCGV